MQPRDTLSTKEMLCQDVISLIDKTPLFETSLASLKVLFKVKPLILKSKVYEQLRPIDRIGITSVYAPVITIIIIHGTFKFAAGEILAYVHVISSTDGTGFFQILIALILCCPVNYLLKENERCSAIHTSRYNVTFMNCSFLSVVLTKLY